MSAEIVSYSYFYWNKYDCNWVTKLRSRYYCNMSRMRPRLIRCHWSFDPRWVKISGHSEQLGPCGSTSHFVNNRHSKVKTRGAACIGGFGQTDGRRKFELGIPQSRGAAYIRGASYIRDKTVLSMSNKILRQMGGIFQLWQFLLDQIAYGRWPGIKKWRHVNKWKPWSFQLHYSRSRTSGQYLWATYQLRPLCMVAFQRVGGSSGWLELNSVQIKTLFKSRCQTNRS